MSLLSDIGRNGECSSQQAEFQINYSLKVTAFFPHTTNKDQTKLM
ncbi:hypothetical protein BS78_07G106400 [Paspalum vaginatum]|nr:hypothetical protein BS78_07G106400 [Paspalum vaginatum]